jgi:hypothetical protein
LVIVPVGALTGVREACGAIREWVRGRYRVLREREDRATTELVLRDLDEGLWMDRDGDRLRLIIKPFRHTGDGQPPPLTSTGQVLRLEQGDDGTSHR